MVGVRMHGFLFWLHCGLGVCGNGSIGCTNNNYASREKCNKCGQPKEVAAMPAIAIPGASFPTQLHHFSRYGIQPADKFGVQQSAWPFYGNSSSVVPFANPTNQIIGAPKGWRNGDWICNCGFHNYSSRTQCKKCNAFMPPAVPSPLAGSGASVLGTKRLASDEFTKDWDRKRLNAGQKLGLLQAFPAIEHLTGSGGNHTTSVYPSYTSSSSAVTPNLEAEMQLQHIVTAPTLPGKGAKQWRNGDWMCSNCNNHNYSSRVQCNRCKTPREVHSQIVSVA